MNKEIIEEITKKIQNEEYNKVDSNNNTEYNLCTKTEEIEEAQLGYRYNPKTQEQIEDWIGDNYYVIGYNTLCGDPIIIDVDDKDNPVYYMWHDNWSTLKKISSSLHDFISILKVLNTNEDNETKLEKIKEIDPECYEYWYETIKSENDNEINTTKKLQKKNKIIGYIGIILIILLIVLAILLSIHN